jgi:hypothetical protein
LAPCSKLEESQQGMMAHACSPSTQEAKMRGSKVQGQPGVHIETLPQKTNTETNLKTHSHTLRPCLQFHTSRCILWRILYTQFLCQETHVSCPDYAVCCVFVFVFLSVEISSMPTMPVSAICFLAYLCDDYMDVIL